MPQAARASLGHSWKSGPSQWSAVHAHQAEHGQVAPAQRRWNMQLLAPSPKSILCPPSLHAPTLYRYVPQAWCQDRQGDVHKISRAGGLP